MRREKGWFAWSEALEKAPQPILILDRNLKIVAENSMARRLIGQNIGRHCAEALGCPLGFSCQGQDGDLEVRLPGTKGNGKMVHLHHRLLHRRDGARWMVALEEVNPKKNSEPDELVLLSHELLSPLGTLKSYATVLQEMKGRIPDEQERRYLLAIERLCSRLTRLVGNVIESWRLEKGGFDLALRSVSLPSLVRSVALELQEEAPNHCIRVKVPRVMPRLSLDETKVRLLLMNLIENALKYSPQGGTIEIVSEYIRSEDELPQVSQDQEGLPSLLPFALTQVRDEGIGIPMQELENVFAPFYRVNNGLPPLGKGLGLYLCKAIVEAHGGRIWARSQPGKGSTFSFLLPRNGIPAQHRLVIA